MSSRSASASAWRALWLPVSATLAIQTVGALAIYCAPVMAPVAGPALGVPASWIGYYIALLYMGSMFSSVIAGTWVARFGAVRVSQIGLLFNAVGLFGASVGWLPLVAFGGFLVGVGYGPGTPASSHILLRAAPPGFVAFTFSLKQTGVPLGAAIAGVLVPALLLLCAWQGSAIVIGLMCVLLAVLIQPTRQRWDLDRDAQAPMTFRGVFRPLRFALNEPRLMELAITSFVFGGVQITFVAYLVTFLTYAFDLSLVVAGLVMAVSQCASVAGRVLWGVAADRWLSSRKMLGLLGLGMGACALLTLTANAQWPIALLFVFAAVFGATAVGWNGVFLAEVARVAPTRVSEATGGCLFFTYLGVVLSPPLFSMCLSVGGSYASAYAIVGAPALLMGLWLLFNTRHSRVD